MGNAASACNGERCSQCKAALGCCGKTTPCPECSRSLCSGCLSHPVVTEAAQQSCQGEVRDQDIVAFCKGCFQKLSSLDFSKHVDVFEAVGGGGAITLVYVHGGGGSREMFKPHARAMAAKNFRCVLMDLPGHGARMDEELTMNSALQAIVQVIREYAPPSASGTKPIYIGGSLGGYVGMELLGKFPDLVSMAIITMCGQNVGVGRGAAASMGLWAFETILPRLGSRKIMSALIGEIRKNGHLPEEAMMECSFRPGMFFGQAMAQVQILKASDPSAALGKFPGPILFVNGSKDHRDSEHLWVEKSQKGQLIVYEGADHFFSHDDRHSKRFEEDCYNFIKQHAAIS
ncbi:unnamed protein product [Effrenium voratum]|nr:unnamed protein product [Effrenium voratum]